MNAPTAFGPSPRARGQLAEAALALREQRSTPAYAGTTGARLGAVRRLPLHPRVRGDNWKVSGVAPSPIGPPPRTRGQRETASRYRLTRRSTPAYAGTTLAEPRPRLSGHGPPPRTRGQRQTSRPGGPGHRSTPAYAGTTWATGAGRRRRAVHPRVRGDNVHDDLGLGVARRSTPAYAGTTPSAMRTSSARTVHPRVRGDNVVAVSMPSEVLGPPPRTRGQRRHPGYCTRRERSTPAYAGTTASMSSLRRSYSVHPRVRGDNADQALARALEHGPPPRTRGQRERVAAPPRDGRSTPAYAGTTAVGVTQAAISSVHPRVRGDNAPTVPGSLPQGGPPPRTRGQRPDERR